MAIELQNCSKENFKISMSWLNQFMEPGNKKSKPNSMANSMQKHQHLLHNKHVDSLMYQVSLNKNSHNSLKGTSLILIIKMSSITLMKNIIYIAMTSLALKSQIPP